MNSFLESGLVAAALIGSPQKELDQESLNPLKNVEFASRVEQVVKRFPSALNLPAGCKFPRKPIVPKVQIDRTQIRWRDPRDLESGMRMGNLISLVVMNKVALRLAAAGILPDDSITEQILKVTNNGEIPDGKKVLVVGGEDGSISLGRRDNVLETLEVVGGAPEEVLMFQVGKASHDVWALLEEAGEALDLKVIRRMLEPDPTVLPGPSNYREMDYAEGLGARLKELEKAPSLGFLYREPGMQESPSYSKIPPRKLGSPQKGRRKGWRSS